MFCFGLEGKCNRKRRNTFLWFRRNCKKYGRAGELSHLKRYLEENDENKSVEPLSLQEKCRRDLIKSVKPLLKPYFYNSMRNTVLLYYCLESFRFKVLLWRF